MSSCPRRESPTRASRARASQARRLASVRPRPHPPVSSSCMAVDPPSRIGVCEKAAESRCASVKTEAEESQTPTITDKKLTSWQRLCMQRTPS
eukprot:6210219-Pleurochrysis_carterae.AAC.1